MKSEKLKSINNIITLLLILTIIFVDVAWAIDNVQQKEKYNTLSPELNISSAGIMAAFQNVRAVNPFMQEIQAAAERVGVEIPENTKIILHSAQKMARTITYKVYNDVFAQLKKEGLLDEPYLMVPYPLPDGDRLKFEDLARAVRKGLEVAKESPVVGLIAGTPFKEAGLVTLTICAPIVKYINSAGLLVRRSDAEFWGTFTDGDSWVSWFERVCCSLENKTIVILGAGDVGRAIVANPKMKKAKDITIVDKLGQKAIDVARSLKPEGYDNISVVAADSPEQNIASRELHEAIAQADVVINLSGVGRVPSKIKSPLVDNEQNPLRYKPNAFVVDGNLHLEEDNFLTQASGVTPSVRTENGLGWMIEQNTMQFYKLLGWSPTDERIERVRELIAVSAAHYYMLAQKEGILGDRIKGLKDGITVAHPPRLSLQAEALIASSI